MHLAQHHFQAQSRYFEELAEFGIATLFFKPYGVIACELDAEALLNGTVALTHARGVLPDGLHFHFPGDPAPDPIQIRDSFSPTHESHLILLTVPAQRADLPNCTRETEGDRGSVRYRPGIRVISDETTGRDEKPVAVALKNFRLLLDIEERDGLVTMPLARVRRDGAGHFIYDPEYIPPSLRIGASGRIMALLERLLGILDARAESLMAERRGTESPLREYASREIANYWLSHAIHSGIGPLRHHFQTASAHPDILFTELSRLAGALCTFSLHSHPRDLPHYDHDQLEHSINVLDRQIREQLELVIPTRCLSVPLHTADGHLHRATIADARSFGRSRWYLGVRSSAAAADLAAQLPRSAKVCSAKHVARLVREAFAGLALEHVAAPPAEIAPRNDTQYFTVTQTDPCWRSIVESQEFGVFLPAVIPDAELEVVIVLES
jgi:type VI secretion system protein ImpJ